MKRKNTISQRLNIAQGQIEAIKKIIEENPENCQEILTQFKAANSALNKAVEIYLQNNINSCLSETPKKDKERIQKLLSELMEK